jgi:signal transduction histidine kinase
MIKLQRFYSLTSFIVIFVTAALLTLFYREATLHWVEHLAKNNHQAVAQTALNAIEPELMAHLRTIAGKNALDTKLNNLPAELAEKILRMTRDTTVKRIDIYDHNGRQVYTTHAGSIHPGNHPALQSAIHGDVSSTVIFRSLFTRYAEASADGKLMQTYIPVSREPGAAVLGVFAIHSDPGHLIAESDALILSILVGVELILAILYAILWLVARHAKNIIHTQQTTILERTASLETLSRRLLEGDELQKKRIAADLHEGLAQTLSAIKVNVENNRLKNSFDASAQSLGTIVPVLQHAIHEVRTIATELRPSSLDDLGLLPTLRWFCREFERRHPAISIQREISLAETNIPPLLKIDIYRIIESIFKNIAKHSHTDRIILALHLVDEHIHLIIGDTPTVLPAIAPADRSEPGVEAQFRFAEVKERTALSGGAFSTTLENSGWVTLRSSWAI